jgi:hypothetical protein
MKCAEASEPRNIIAVSFLSFSLDLVAIRFMLRQEIEILVRRSEEHFTIPPLRVSNSVAITSQ